MRRAPLLAILALTAVAASAQPAAAQDAATLPFVAFDIGGGETNYEIGIRSLDGGTFGESFGAVKGKYLRGPSGPQFSPDGKRLLFGGHHKLDRDAQSLWVRTLDGERTRRIPLELTRHGILRGWDWAPNGRRVVFSATRNGVSEVATIYTVELDGSGLRRVARGQYPTWGKGRISFERPGSVHVVRPGGTKARKVAAAKGQYRTNATISPDGGTVLYTKGVREPDNAFVQWRRATVDTGADDVILEWGREPTSPRYADPKFTPDGERIISAKYQPPVAGGADESYRVVTMDTDGQDEQHFFQFGENEPYGRFPALDLQP